jgi:hypothetical protein
MPYGLLGLGAEVGTQYFALVGGIGTAILAGPGWSVGGRVYFLNSTHRFRPHVTVVYGSTKGYDIRIDSWVNGTQVSSQEYTGTVSGVGILIGGDHDIGKIGGLILTYGIGYVTFGDYSQDVKDAYKTHGESPSDLGSHFTFNIGINYRFGG